MSFVLENIHVDLVEDRLGIEEEVIEADDVKEPAYDMNFREKEITIGLLLETIDGMQNYIDELLGEIEKFNSGDKVRMAELEAKMKSIKLRLLECVILLKRKLFKKSNQRNRESVDTLCLEEMERSLFLEHQHLIKTR